MDVRAVHPGSSHLTTSRTCLLVVSSPSRLSRPWIRILMLGGKCGQKRGNDLDSNLPFFFQITMEVIATLLPAFSPGNR